MCSGRLGFSTLSTAMESAFDPFGHLDNQSQQALPWWTSSPSADLWSSLNPLGARELRIDVAPWTILSLRSSNEGQAPPRPPLRRLGALPSPDPSCCVVRQTGGASISGTTALLWMLLLYLLKDTELLDAQRDKSEADPSDTTVDSSITSITTAPKPRTTIFAVVTLATSSFSLRMAVLRPRLTTAAESAFGA